jgi:hypothetical protein
MIKSPDGNMYHVNYRDVADKDNSNWLLQTNFLAIPNLHDIMFLKNQRWKVVNRTFLFDLDYKQIVIELIKA